MSSHFILNAAIKGVIEGFTEFLPISSTGHLILAGHFFPLSEGTPEQVKKFDDLFDIIIQFPAVLAIVILFRKRLWDSVRALPERREARFFWLGIVLAFIPAAVAGVVMKHIIEEKLRFPLPVGIALVAGGIVLILIEKLAARGGTERAEDVPLATALSIGVFQCLALIPGVSRSGATIVGGRLLGLTRRAAAEFSFFLAIPTMAGAFVYKFAKDYKAVNWSADGAVILTGCVFSFLTAWAVVALFMKLIERPNSLAVWGWYRLVLGAAVIYFALR